VREKKTWGLVDRSKEEGAILGHIVCVGGSRSAVLIAELDWQDAHPGVKTSVVPLIGPMSSANPVIAAEIARE
jgi:hypothetical protein